MLVPEGRSFVNCMNIACTLRDHCSAVHHLFISDTDSITAIGPAKQTTSARASTVSEHWVRYVHS
jgi:hypothetical protein